MSLQSAVAIQGRRCFHFFAFIDNSSNDVEKSRLFHYKTIFLVYIFLIHCTPYQSYLLYSIVLMFVKVGVGGTRSRIRGNEYLDKIFPTQLVSDCVGYFRMQILLIAAAQSFV